MSTLGSQLARHALLVGIDRYPFIPGVDLRGAANDVEAMALYLEQRLGFRDTDIHRLLNEGAGRDDILSAFERLAHQVSRDDLVIVHFSGHGSLRANPQNPDGSGRDETLVPFDSGRGRLEDRDITCHEVRELLRHITDKTRRLTVIFDCCHSGTLVRDARGLRIRAVAPSRPLDRPAASRPTGSVPGWWPHDRSYSFFAACRSDEKAGEIQVTDAGTSHGALTYYLLRELHEARDDETYRDVFERLTLAFRSRFSHQHPQLEGAVDRLLFGLRELKPHRFLAVGERAGESAILAGGAAHRVEAGSQWTVFPAGTRDPLGAPVLGELRITAVGAIASEASILEEAAPDSITGGCRAIETRPGDRVPQLSVEIVAEAGLEESSEDLVREIELSRLLRPARGEDAPMMTVYLLAARDGPRSGAPLPELGPLPRACYAVMGEEGALSMPVRCLDRRLALFDLVENLENRSRWLHALTLRNRSPDALAGHVSFEILRGDGGGSWSVVGNNARFESGERFALEITNRSAFPLHVYVIHFAVDGEIQPIYPPRGAWQPVAAKGKASYGQVGDGLSFELHPELPFDHGPGPVEIEETLKLIATTEATDFYPLFQGSYRQLASDDVLSASSLAMLLYRSFLGLSTREVQRRGKGSARESWTTLDRTVRIRGQGPARRDWREKL